MDPRTIIREQISQGATLAEIEADLAEWPALSDEERAALWLYARQSILDTHRGGEDGAEAERAATAQAAAHARRVLEPLRVLPELRRRGKALTGRVSGLPRAIWPSGSTLEEPRPQLPPGRVEYLPAVGDVFFRDTGRPRPRTAGTILLLHGWMVPTDVHWYRTFEMLEALGWRVVAMDSRGHGRGLRPGGPFRLSDCADDAAELVRYLGCGPVVAVGYSMGGTILQLIARDHAEVLSGAVFCATASEFRTSALMRLVWSGMGAFQLYLRIAPRVTWEAFVRLTAQGDPATTAWLVGELRRGAAWDIAEAGREIGRFDSRPWVSAIGVPSAVLVTSRDLLVPAARQRDLARRLGAPVSEIESDHLAPASTPRRFNRALVEALAILEGQKLTVSGAQASQFQA